MSHIVVVGAGITGVTTAYELLQLGFKVTVIDRHLYPAMETSFANGGQLSACNAEVWNSKATILKGLKYLGQANAPLLLNPALSVHKYSWLFEFIQNIKQYHANTTETVRLALLARQRLFEVASKENIAFSLEKRGILHLFHNAEDFAAAKPVNQLLNDAGLTRYAVTPSEMLQIEPALTGEYHGGFYTPDDATGDIHQFCTGLAQVAQRLGATFIQGYDVTDVDLTEHAVRVAASPSSENQDVYSKNGAENISITADAIVVCAGVGSYQLANLLGDRVNIYPVKGYSITVQLQDDASQAAAPWVSLLDESAKIVTSRLGQQRFRVAGTAEFNGYNRDIRADRVQPLIDWVQRNFAVSTEHSVPWAGLRPMMPNMIPVVKQGHHARVFYNTGHGHLGWTLSAATAVMISQLIANKLKRASA